MSVQRYRCEDCDTIVTEDEVVKVPTTKPGSKVVWWVCPHCDTAEGLARICDESDCAELATIGTPTPDGYKQLCRQHGQPFLKANLKKQETLK